MPSFVQKTWVDVPDEANPPVGAVATEAAEFNRLEQGIVDSIDHANAVYAVHGGLVWYVAASGVPPTLPPAGLPWWRTDTKEAVVNTGTPSVPVWESAAVDPAKLTAADLVTDYVVSGLLPSIPTNSLTLSVPSGAAYASGRRVSKATTNQTVPGRKATLVDLSYLGVFSNVDYGILLDDTEDTWLEKTDADFTQSVVAGPTGQGNAVRFVIAAGATAGDSVSEAIPIADLTPYGKIAVWVRSSVAVTAGQLQLLLDNTAQVASPVHTLNIPALTANAWTLCEIAYDNTQVGTGSIISLGFKYTVDIGAATVDICKPYALKATEPAVSANSLRLFEARADADIAQVELVDITTAVNSTAYTVRINGVDVVYTSDASATEGEIALGLVAALNASVDPAVTPITASTAAIAGDASATLTITADVPGVAFTILVGANLSVANQVPNSTSSVIEVVDRRDLDPTLRGGVLGAAASGVTFTPTGTIAATNAQAAIAEVAAEAASGFSLTSPEFFDDFISGSITTGSIGALGWQSSGGSAISNQAAEQHHPGILRRDTGTSSGANAYIRLGAASTTAEVIHTLDNFDMTFLIRVNTNDANTTVRAGIGIGSSNPPPDGIYIEKLAADTQWFGVTRASSTQSRTAALATVSTNWVKLRMRRIDASTMGFFVDGATEVTATANIPSVATFIFLHIVNTAAASKTVDIDYFYMKLTGLTR